MKQHISHMKSPLLGTFAPPRYTALLRPKSALNYIFSLVEEAHLLFGTESGLQKAAYDLPTFFVLLESDVNPKLPMKWSWIPS